MKVGDRVEVVDGPDEHLYGWTGVITKVYGDGDVVVDLDAEQDLDIDMTGCLFEDYELIVLRS
jgi:hypothetical protein